MASDKGSTLQQKAARANTITTFDPLRRGGSGARYGNPANTGAMDTEVEKILREVALDGSMD
jgi:hypothetical protein